MIPICLGFPGLVQTSSNQVKQINKNDAIYTFLDTPSRFTSIDKGLNFAYKSPKRSPRTGTPIHKKTHKIKGVIETFADSLLIKPGIVNKIRTKRPNIFPLGDCFVENSFSSEVKIDSFQETFKKTKVTTTVKTAAFKTILKGIGKSPTFIIP
tara:strand:+ start:706 stop:1164 length:459 start_codon:yes stop_codon:yes gene_type:complete